ncbi:nucleoside hydrolase [Nocardiopsis salina]|uniref:nucleoside hydrolase n=1 Tax=Nocardiopsis salina TaxID=245836 RepID=UPI00034B5C8B|nr:nucleoside hydrolase [Nocardiopsis salina]
MPASHRALPVVLDTDIGGDPDDAITVAAAARTLPGLALVLTNDETGAPLPHGERARFARHLLDLLERGDVATVAGHGVGGTRYFCAQGLAPASVPEQGRDVVGAVRALLDRTDGEVLWVGMGALSNLATVLVELPEAAGRLAVTQMGGSLAYRDPSRAEHNIRMDVPAAHAVFEAIAAGQLEGVRLVTSDITFRTEIEVVPGGPVHHRLAQAATGGWQHLLHHHLEGWFEAFHPGSMQHDALALSTALDEPYVGLRPERVVLDPVGRTQRSGPDDRGAAVRMSVSAEYGAFNRWLERGLFGGESAEGHQGCTSTDRQ